MAKKDKLNEHEGFVKKQNEWCFLPNKQNIKYNSIIILEIFKLEDFDDLIKGLDRLYKDISLHKESHLEYRTILQNSKNKLFETHSLNLPYISDLKFKGKILPSGVFHKLGDYINHLHIHLYQILPSTVVLQIQASMDIKVSNQINKIIYKYHKEVREPIKTAKGKYTKIYHPEYLKEKEISSIRNKIKKQIINFLSEYFKGNFFSLSDNDVSIVPSIDVYSLNYPLADKDIIKWGIQNSSFFHCFGTNINEHLSFKYNQYLFCLDESQNFYNYLIFANREISQDNIYSNIDSAIEGTLNFCCFDLLAISRWLEIQERLAGNFNSILSQEIEKLNKNKLKDVIINRKDIYREIFYFERFKTEFKHYSLMPDKFNFKSIDGKNGSLFDNLTKNIKNKIENIEEILNTFNKNSESILGLKNIEYSKKMQDLVLCLTVIVILLTLIQIFLALRNPQIIINFVSNLRNILFRL